MDRSFPYTASVEEEKESYDMPRSKINKNNLILRFLPEAQLQLFDEVLFYDVSKIKKCMRQ